MEEVDLKGRTPCAPTAKHFEEVIEVDGGEGHCVQVP